MLKGGCECGSAKRYRYILSNCNSKKQGIFSRFSLLERGRRRSRQRLVSPASEGLLPERISFDGFWGIVRLRKRIPCVVRFGVYRCEVSTPEGFVQQVAVSYLAHGYFFYVAGVIPEGKDTRRVDQKLV